MRDLVKKTIEKRVEIILSEFSFKTRQKRNKEECSCYSQNKPCHELTPGRLNCFFCLCPEYDNSKKEGGCKIGNPEEKGKVFNYPGGTVWDCSNCTYPHRKNNIRKYLNRIFGLREESKHP